jgi:hypothetical protein
MPDFYFILFLMRLDADDKLQYFQLPYIPCRMVSGNEIKLCLKYFCLPTVCTTHSYHVNENLERVPPVGNILSIKAAFGDLETFITGLVFKSIPQPQVTVYLTF